MKFDTVTHIGPVHETFRIFENPRWRNESNNLQPKVKRKYWYIKLRSQIQTQENKNSKYKCKKLNSLNMVLEAKSHV